MLPMDLKAFVNSSGLANRPAIAPTTIIDTPHQIDHWLTISAREMGTTWPLASVRATMSPCSIISGARMARLTMAPISTLEATATPIRPPMPSIAKSSEKRRPSWRMSVPRIFGAARFILASHA